jgi:glucose/arabinose dehydrogenase
MLKRAVSILGLSLLGCALVASSAAAAGKRSSAPTHSAATKGHTPQVFATGLTTPTSFAFGAGQVFEGDGGNPPAEGGDASAAAVKPGGVYVLKNGGATSLPGSPDFVAGLAWHRGTLYVSAANFGAGGAITSQILAWSGWNGTTFTKQRVFYTAPSNFPGFNGLAIGPYDRLYVGVSTSESNDHGPPVAPYQYDILSFGLDGKGPKVFASGMRQPWQMAFAWGDHRPYVTDLGQETGATNPPDFVLHVHKGDNYGFPQCNWTVLAACRGFAKPFLFFAPHTDVGGIAIVGDRIYLSEFGLGGKPAQVVSVPLKSDRRWNGDRRHKSRTDRRNGDSAKVVAGFAAPIIGLGAHHDWLYVGSLNGTVYRVHA